MSMSDPRADMFTRIRNAVRAEHADVLYLFDKGSIVEFGTYKELKKNKTTFINKMGKDSL